MPVPARVLTRSIESWFRRHQRPLPWRSSYDPYLVWVSEVMLQQTRMEVVLRYFDRFAGRFPTLASLASSPDDQVLAAWSGLGYYRRARMLAAGAREVVARFGGEVPRDVASLRSIPGIGRYTAGAIASIAFEQREPIVDGNVARVLARVYAIDKSVTTTAWHHADELIRTSADPRAFNQGLMELGALVCTPQSPGCPKCPIRKHCTAYVSGRVESFPPPKEKRVARKEIVPLYLIDDGRGHLLMRRDITSMLHLPQGPLDGVVAKTLVGSFRHTITTRNIVFEVHRASLTRIADSSDYTWVDPSKLGDLPHPSYVAKALKLANVPSPAAAGEGGRRPGEGPSSAASRHLLPARAGRRH